MQKNTIAVFLSSGNPFQFREWINKSWHYLDKHTTLFLSPWGNNASFIEDIAPSNSIIVKSYEGSTYEDNKNASITEIANTKSFDLIFFLDDDTIISQSWLDEILNTVSKYPEVNAYSSLVRNRDLDSIQSCGHYFRKGSPLDARNLDSSKLIQFPCANCATVKWEAIEKILQIDPHVWDSRFGKWQTCFNFGLKMILTNSRTIFASNANAQHTGYLMWNENDKAEKYKTSIADQLRSRILLYHKFFPNSYFNLAIDAIINKIKNKWLQLGYPNFNKYTIGVDLLPTFEEEYAKAESLWNKNPDKCWLKIMSARDDIRLILGF